MNFFRGQLNKGDNSKYLINSNKITVINLGPGSILVNFDNPSHDGLLIPFNTGRTFNTKKIVEYVHVAADEETTIQIDGL